LGYVQHDPFSGLVLPERDPLNERCLTVEEMRAVIEAASEPYKTYYWILAETGVRAGEIGALTVPNLLLDVGVLRIAQSVWHGKIQTVKSKKGNRICEISRFCGPSSRVREFPQAEPFGSLVCVQQWNTLGHRHGAEAQTLSSAEEFEDRALRIPRLSPWQCHCHGSGAGAHGHAAESARAV